MIIIASDTFTRANQAGWGTASDGHVWAEPVGTGWSLTSNAGLVNSTSNNFFLLGSGVQGDTEGFCQSVVGNLAGGDWFGPFLRATHDALNGYVARSETGTNTLVVERWIAGVRTTITSNPFTFTTAHIYAIRFRVMGTLNPHLQARIWDTSGSEQATWDIDVIDNSISQISGIGQYGLFGSDGTSGDIQFTSAIFSDLSPETTKTPQLPPLPFSNATSPDPNRTSNSIYGGNL